MLTFWRLNVQNLLFLAQTNAADIGYYGTKIGPLSQLHHGVSGDVYAVDSRTLFLKNFNYDGEGPGKDSMKRLCLFISMDRKSCFHATVC